MAQDRAELERRKQERNARLLTRSVERMAVVQGTTVEEVEMPPEYHARLERERRAAHPPVPRADPTLAAQRPEPGPHLRSLLSAIGLDFGGTRARHARLCLALRWANAAISAVYGLVTCLAGLRHFGTAVDCSALAPPPSQACSAILSAGCGAERHAAPVMAALAGALGWVATPRALLASEALVLAAFSLAGWAATGRSVMRALAVSSPLRLAGRRMASVLVPLGIVSVLVTGCAASR